MDTETSQILEEAIALCDSILLSGYWWQTKPHRFWQRHSPAQVTQFAIGSRVERCACGQIRLSGYGWFKGTDRRRTIRQWKRDQHGD